MYSVTIMKHFFYFLSFIGIASTSVCAQAQIPVTSIKPVPAPHMDTLQQPLAATAFETSKDEKTGHIVYKGTFTCKNMASEPTFAWLDSGIVAYKPDTLTLPYLSSTIRQYNILVFVGTWCEDSQNLLPKLYKLLQSIDISYENIVLIGMDRAKTTTTTAGIDLVSRYKVALLPTILFTDSNGEEVGRITESVSKSIEWDLVDLFSKANKNK